MIPDSQALIRPKKRQRILEPVRDWVVDPATGCWEWQNYRGHHGYARCTNGPAHREVWRQAGRLLADEDHLHHRCENRGCVNPDHMEPKAPTPHLTDHRQADSTLTWDDVRAIRAANKAGIGIYVQAETYGLRISTLQKLIAGETWVDPNYVPGVERACDECGETFRTTKVTKRFCRKKCRDLFNGRRTGRRIRGQALDGSETRSYRRAA